MRIAVPDLLSNSYFPAAAAVALGYVREAGCDLVLEHIAPVEACVQALREGRVAFIGASAHAPLLSFPDWQGARLLCAQSQGMYWSLVVRSDLRIARGDLAALRGRRIAAVPFVAAALRAVLRAAGLDPQALEILIPPAARQPGVNFGVAAAQALERGEIDGFFANGLGAELAVASGHAHLVLDIRHGDGPSACVSFTQPAVATTERVLEQTPEAARALVCGVLRAQAALRSDPAVLEEAVRRLFPPPMAAAAAAVIRRDLALYSPELSPAFIERMSAFAFDLGLLSRPRMDYAQVVAPVLAGLEKSGAAGC